MELRGRLFYIAFSLLAWSIVGYIFQTPIIRALLLPAHGERFYYNSPGGGFDFILKVCVYFGLLMSTPVIVYHLLKFVEPLIGKNARQFIARGSLLAGGLAIGGVLFGYFLGLPVALKFLINQFSFQSISAQITISSYLSFVIAYLAGASLIFQVPLWMYIINRIKPLSLRVLIKNQRWVILISFIIAALINPSPRPQDLFLLALPLILSYEVGLIVVWQLNRHKRPAAVQALSTKDRELQQSREAKLATLQYLIEPLESLVTAGPETIHSSTADKPKK